MSVLFDASKKQTEFLEKVLDQHSELIMFGGAIRGGKTFAGLGGLILLCKMYPMSRWAVVRKDYPTIRRNIYPPFRKIVPESFCKGGTLARALNHQSHTVTFNNGSEIIFFPESYNDDKELNRWKGLEVNGFLLEEANELQEVAFWKAVERSGSWVLPKGFRQPPSKILMTCNPAQNWVKTLIYEPAQSGILPNGWHYIQARIFDNPHLPKAYVKGLKRLPREQYRVFVEGDWEVKLKTGAEFYGDFSLEACTGFTRYDRKLPLHISWDENVNPYLPVSIWQGTGKTLKCVGSIAFPAPLNTVRKVCDELLRRYRFHTEGVYIYGDATSRKRDTKIEAGSNFFTLVAKYLAQWKPILRVPKSNPSVAMRGRFINSLFLGEVDGCKVLIGDKLDMMIHDLSNVYEDSDGTKLKSKTKDPKTGVTYEKNGHFSDTLDYIVCEYFKKEFRAFQRPPSDPSQPRVLKLRPTASQKY